MYWIVIDPPEPTPRLHLLQEEAPVPGPGFGSPLHGVGGAGARQHQQHLVAQHHHLAALQQQAQQQQQQQQGSPTAASFQQRLR